MIITLDGFSGTGKSTLGKLIAEKLNFKYLNTGMIYRALTYYFVNKNITYNNSCAIEKELKNINVVVFFKNSEQNISVNNDVVTDFLSNRVVQENVSYYSKVKSIRDFTTQLQRDFASSNDIVVEGRDIGSCVFPNAEYKFFVICDVEVRAKRRLQDLIKKGYDINYEEVVLSLQERDRIDSSREISPLVKPDGAIIIDTSHKNIDESINEILSYIKRAR